MCLTSIDVSIRLAQLLTELNVSEAESFHPMYKSDMAALEEFIKIKRSLRREHGIVGNIPRNPNHLQRRNYDFDYSFLAERRQEGIDDSTPESEGA